MNRQVNAILIVNPFGIGDVLFTTPMIENLKRGHPPLRIGYLCNRRASAVLKDHPHVDQMIVYERDDWVRVYRESKPRYLKLFLDLIHDLRQEHYDLVIDLSMSPQFGWLMAMAGIKRRVGYNFRGRGLWLTDKFPFQGFESRHVVEYYLDLLRELDVEVVEKNLQLHITDDDEAWALECLQAWGIRDTAPRVMLVPGGGSSWGPEAPAKRWPAEKYAELADLLIEKHKATIILSGDRGDLSICDRVREKMSGEALSICGLSTIKQFGALTRRCDLTITNYGGPLHIAVAAGAKTCSIFGPVDERVYGPYPRGEHIVVHHEIMCRPCYRRFRKASCEHLSCLNQITPAAVLAAIEGAL